MATFLIDAIIIIIIIIITINDNFYGAITRINRFKDANGLDSAVLWCYSAVLCSIKAFKMIISMR